MDTDSTINSATLPDEPAWAAQYVRMSTEHQRYSTENQAEVIAEYAARHGMQIVRTVSANLPAHGVSSWSGAGCVH
jgi:hypothetical protein